MEAIKNKLIEVAEAVKKYNGNDAGLLSGNIGMALFCATVNQLLQDGNLDSETERLLHKSFGLLDNGNVLHNFGDGYAGICWGVNHLALQNKIDVDINDLFGEIEPHLSTTLNEDLDENFFDFIHGGLGACVYFLDRLPDETAEQNLVNAVKLLHKHITIKEENDITWANMFIRQNKASHVPEYNLGLSHGMPAIVWFLSKCYQKNIEPARCKLMVNGAMQWIIKQKLSSPSISLYPSYIDSSSHGDSRLAWCYGDLGIATTIWQAGKIFDNEAWKEEASEIMLHASKRRDLKENIVRDAGLCHGTAGIAHIFNRFYRETKNPIFKETAGYWIEKTLEMACHEDGLAGFKSWDGATKTWNNEYGLLEGITGIGLALYSFISDEEPYWDRCLLLN